MTTTTGENAGFVSPIAHGWATGGSAAFLVAAMKTLINVYAAVIGKIELHMIEVQSGTYLGEDDIVRFEDIYQRN